MGSHSFLVRCAVLALSAACAMPLMTDASHVRGGDDVPNCDTTGLSNTGSCVARPGQTCNDNKKTCYACTGMNQIKESKCATTTTAACGGAGCVAGQTDSALSGNSCIVVGCP